jgi:hypothetical protein
LEAFEGKIVFSGGSVAILEFLEWLEGVGAKDKGSSKFCGSFGDFWRVYGGLGPNRKYFFETEGPTVIFSSG